MKVLLIQVNRDGGIEKNSHPHAGLAYLGSYSLHNGHETIAIDGRYEGISNEEITRRVIAAKPDVLGITVKTPDVRAAERIAKATKEAFPATRILVGGAHVSGLGAQVLEECSHFDLGVIGEGEQTFCELLEAFDNGNHDLSHIKGLLYREGDKILGTPPREHIPDLDTLLLPSWQLFPTQSDLPLFSSRGCPFNCIFCQRVMGQKVRTMSPERLIEEMKRNIEEFGCTFFQIEDEVFGINKKWMDRALDMMIEEGIHHKAQWCANSRVNIADLEMFKKMKKAGCVKLDFGIESGNQKILDTIRKGFKLEQAVEAIKLAKEAGLKTDAFFILGHPGETRRTIRDTINFASKLNSDYTCFGMMIPYPGTEIYEMAKNGEGGYKGFHEDWEFYTKYFGKGLELDGLSSSTLERYQKQAYIEFYLRNFRIADLLRFVGKYLKAKA